MKTKLTKVWRLYLLGLLLFGVALLVIGQGLKISQFPNVSTPGDSDLFVLARTSTTPGTNINTRYDQLRLSVTNGLATVSYVNTITNGLATTNYVNAITNGLATTNYVNDATNGLTGIGFAAIETLTNSVRVALSTNQNWVSGVTGLLSGTTVVLGVDIFSITNGLGGGGGSVLFNPDQFEPSSTHTNIKSGALVTNLSSLSLTNRGSTVHSPTTAPGALATFVNDGTATLITNILAADSTLLVSNLNDGQSIKWFLFSSNGGWNMTFPQVTRSNSNTRGFIPQPFTNTWTSFSAIRHGVVTNFVFDGQEFDLGAGVSVFLTTNLVTETVSINVTNTSNFSISTTDFVLNAYNTNTGVRAWVSCVVGMTNVAATDKALIGLYLDQNGDGTFEQTGILQRLQGIASLAGAFQLSAFIQPNARFLYTNLSSGSAVVAIETGSSQFVKH